VDEEDSIVVVGVGTVLGKPDQVRARVGVSAVAPTIAEALTAAAGTQERLLSVATGAGLARSSIQTSGYRAGHDYQAQPASTRYRVDASLVLLLPDLARAGEVLAEMAAEAGDAFEIHGVSPEISDPEPLRATAREAAVIAARTKAEQLAAAAGVRLGRLRSIVEGASARFAMPAGGRAGLAMMDAAPDVEGGELTVSVAVTVVFEITQ
jgi:uncharacterized protein YggE